jgi:uncharacterized protein
MTCLSFILGILTKEKTEALRPMKFSRKYRLLLNALVLSSLFGSQAALGKPPTENALLWEISGQGLKQPSYLFGTIHAACPDQIILSNPLRKAFNTSGQLYLEVDLDDPNIMSNSLRGSTLKSGTSLKNYLSTKDYSKANQFFQKNVGLPLDSLATIKPIILSALVYPVLLNCKAASWENTFVTLAHAQKKNVLGLETIQAQFNAIDSIPPKIQAEQMMETINDLPGAKKELAGLLTAYKNQDISKIRQLIAQSPGMKPEYDAAIIDNRNRTWIPTILNAAKTKPTFFGVGAGHLGGKYGVIALLRQAGYVVMPVETSISKKSK